MTEKLDSLINALRIEDEATLAPIGLEARVWQALDASPRPHSTAFFVMQALRALPVIITLVLGGAVGARAMTTHDDVSAFAPVPAYSVMQLVK
jgi:predicted exporter